MLVGYREKRDICVLVGYREKRDMCVSRVQRKKRERERGSVTAGNAVSHLTLRQCQTVLRAVQLHSFLPSLLVAGHTLIPHQSSLLLYRLRPPSTQ